MYAFMVCSWWKLKLTIEPIFVFTWLWAAMTVHLCPNLVPTNNYLVMGVYMRVRPLIRMIKEHPNAWLSFPALHEVTHIMQFAPRQGCLCSLENKLSTVSWNFNVVSMSSQYVCTRQLCNCMSLWGERMRMWDVWMCTWKLVTYLCLQGERLEILRCRVGDWGGVEKERLLWECDWMLEHAPKSSSHVCASKWEIQEFGMQSERVGRSLHRELLCKCGMQDYAHES